MHPEFHQCLEAFIVDEDKRFSGKLILEIFSSEMEVFKAFFWAPFISGAITK